MPAIVFGSQRVTCQQLDEDSSRVANALIQLGAKKGEYIAILMSYTPHWIINYFGVIKAGGTAVILNAIRDAIPKAGSGKMNRRALKEMRAS